MERGWPSSGILAFREKGQEFGGGQHGNRGTDEVRGIAGDDGVEAGFYGAGDLQEDDVGVEQDVHFTCFLMSSSSRIARHSSSVGAGPSVLRIPSRSLSEPFRGGGVPG